MNTPLLSSFTLLLLVGCAQPTPTPPSESVPRVRDASVFEELDGMQVRAEGTYVQVDVRKRIRDGGEPVHRGHTAVTLADGHRLHIEPTWSDAAIRSPDEIREFDGQLVIVTGTLHNRCPTPPEPMAAIISPCLEDVRTIQLRQ